MNIIVRGFRYLYRLPWRAEEGQRRRTKEWTALGGVHSRILGCSAVPPEGGILGHGRTRVHVLQTLWGSHRRRGRPPTDGRAVRVMDSSSGWDGDVLRLSRFQEQGFGTGVRGSVQNLATWLSPCAATSGGCVESPGIEALYTRDMFPVVSSSVVRSPYVYYR